MRQSRVLGLALMLGGALTISGQAYALGGGHAGGGAGGGHFSGGGAHISGGGPTRMGGIHPHMGDAGGGENFGYGSGIATGALLGAYGGYGYGYPDAGYDTGYYDPSYANGGVQYGYEPSQPVETGRSEAEPGGLCSTPIRTCTLAHASFVGSPCSCRIVGGGRSGGHVTN